MKINKLETNKHFGCVCMTRNSNQYFQHNTAAAISFTHLESNKRGMKANKETKYNSDILSEKIN